MAIMIIDDKHLEDIAEAIRGKNGSTDTYKPREMAAAIEALSTGTGDGGGTSEDAVASYPKITNVTSFSSEPFDYTNPDTGSTANINYGTVFRYTIDTSIYNTDVTLGFKYKCVKPVGDAGYGANRHDGFAIVYRFNPTSDENIVNSTTIDGYGVPIPTITSQDSVGYIVPVTSNATALRSASLTIPADVHTVVIETYVSQVTLDAVTGSLFIGGTDRGSGRIDLSDFTIQGA